MTDVSPRFRLPFILPAQAQKEAFHNEALIAIDSTLHACIQSAGAVAPPVDPQPGESWIVGDGATGEWAGQVDRLATWTSGGWRFVSPVPGMTVWDMIAGYWLHWAGASWVDGALPASALVIDGYQVVGPRQADIPTPSGGTIIDQQARDTIVLLIATLKSHGLID